MIFFPISAAIAAYVFYRAFTDCCQVFQYSFEPELLVVDAPELESEPS